MHEQPSSLGTLYEMLQRHFSSEVSSCPYAHFVAMALPRARLLLQERPYSQLKHVHDLSGVRRNSFLLDKADHLQAFTMRVRFATSQQACCSLLWTRGKKQKQELRIRQSRLSEYCPHRHLT